jgi:hypothetical protein
VFLITVFLTSAQKGKVNLILVRQDTVLLKAEECEWIIRSLHEIDPALPSGKGRSVSQMILESVKKGKLKAVDPLTGKLIPGKEIYKWKMPVDSMAVMERNSGRAKVNPVQRSRSADQISRIRIFNNWYLDALSGRLIPVARRIELMEEVRTAAGNPIGYAVLCRIDY